MRTTTAPDHRYAAPHRVAAAPDARREEGARPRMPAVYEPVRHIMNRCDTLVPVTDRYGYERFLARP